MRGDYYLLSHWYFLVLTQLTIFTRLILNNLGDLDLWELVLRDVLGLRLLLGLLNSWNSSHLLLQIAGWDFNHDSIDSVLPSYNYRLSVIIHRNHLLTIHLGHLLAIHLGLDLLLSLLISFFAFFSAASPKATNCNPED